VPKASEPRDLNLGEPVEMSLVFADALELRAAVWKRDRA